MSLLLALGMLAAPASAPSWWTAPAECPSEADVAALLADESAALPPDQRAAIDVRASVVATDHGTWSLTVDVRREDASVHRTMELDSCAAAGEATALIYGVALTTIAEPDAPAPEPEVVAEVPPESESVPQLAPPPEAAPASNTTAQPDAAPRDAARPPEDSQQRPSRVRLGGWGAVLAGGGFGGLGPAGGELELSGGVSLQRIRVGLTAAHGIVRRVRVDDVGGNLTSTTGGVRLAVPVAVAGDRFELVPSATASAGALRGRGIGGASAFTRWIPWVVLSGGLDTTWRVTPHVGVRVGARLDVPLLRHRFVFDQLAVSTTRRAGGRVLAGVEFRFPQ